MISIHEIEKNYSSYPTDKILKIAKFESKGLTDGAAMILKKEIIKRNLDPELLEWIEATRRIISGNEQIILHDKIFKSKCTKCNLNSSLSGIRITTEISYLIDNMSETFEYILCNACADIIKKESLLQTLTLGWWSVPGFISTPFVLTGKLRNRWKHDEINK